MWFWEKSSSSVETPPPKSFFSPEQYKQILVIALGGILAAVSIYLLWNLAKLLNWIGGKLHSLLGGLLSILYNCILLAFGIASEIGRLATGLLLVTFVALLAWAYANTPSLGPLQKLFLDEIIRQWVPRLLNSSSLNWPL